MECQSSRQRRSKSCHGGRQPRDRRASPHDGHRERLSLNHDEKAMATTASLWQGYTLGLGLSLLAVVAPANAEDIDLYSRSSGSGERPNVLFILDDSANWSTSLSGAVPDCY